MPTAGRPGRGDWRQTLACGVFAILCASLAWSGMILGFGTAHPLQAVSGHSMRPTLRTGDLVVIRAVSAWRLRVGEIVAVHVPVADQITYHYPPEIVHRISALYVDGTSLTVQTKGDSQGPDPFVVPASAVTGRMLFDVPYAGYGFLFLKSRQGHIALIGLAVLLLLYLGVTALVGASEGVQTREPLALGAEGQNLALAIREYGDHLRSHTKVVRELGDTTSELRDAAATQNEILQGLRLVVTTLAASGLPLEAVASASRSSPRAEPLPFPSGPGSPEGVATTAGTAERARQGGTGGQTEIRRRREKGRHRRRRDPRVVGVKSATQLADNALYPNRSARKRRRA